MPTIFSHACLLFFTSCITPKRFQDVFPFHSPLFVKGSYFNWNLALILLTSSLPPLPFSFDCYSRKKRECNPCLFTECVQSLNSLVLPSIQTLLHRAHPHRDSSISLFASAFSSSHAAGCYCIQAANSTSPLLTLFPLRFTSRPTSFPCCWADTAGSVEKQGEGSKAGSFYSAMLP